MHWRWSVPNIVRSNRYIKWLHFCTFWFGPYLDHPWRVFKFWLWSIQLMMLLIWKFQYLACLVWKRIFTLSKLGIWEFDLIMGNNIYKAPKRHIFVLWEFVSFERKNPSNRLTSCDCLKRYKILFKWLYFTYLPRSPQWTVLHRILHNSKDRRHNHLWQIFGNRMRYVNSVGGGRNSPFPIDKACRCFKYSRGDVFFYRNRKLSSTEDRGQTYPVVPWPWPMTSDLDLHSQVKVKGHSVQKLGWKWTDRWMEASALPPVLTRSVNIGDWITTFKRRET